MRNHLLSFIFLFVIFNSLCYAQTPTPTLWGMTSSGGQSGTGVIFSYSISTGIETDVHDFGSGSDGEYPQGSLILANNGLLYGMTQTGGNNDDGIIFSYNISNNTEIVLHSFTGDSTDGYGPEGSLIQSGSGLLYGMTNEGGAYKAGIIFNYNITADTEIDIHDFGSGTDGSYPTSALVQVNDSVLYGLTFQGGVYGLGTIFSYNILTGTESDVYDFGNGTDGYNPQGSLIQASNGLLYGMTSSGGTDTSGIIFSYNILTGKDSDIYNFGNGADGQSPFGSLMQANNGLLYGMTSGGGTNSVGIIFSFNSSTGKETVIHNFGNGSDGQLPQGSLIQARNGLLYGMTLLGGADNDGMIFSFNDTTYKETDVNDFLGTNGESPYSDLIEVDSAATGISQSRLSRDRDSGQLSFYPNPTSGEFAINLTNNQNDYTVEIYNVVGEKIYQSGLSNLQNTINLCSQPAGLYFVYLKSDEGIDVGKVLVIK